MLHGDVAGKEVDILKFLAGMLLTGASQESLLAAMW